MIDPLIIKAIALGMGLLFLTAAWHKLNSPAEFKASLVDYQLLPEWLIKPVGLALPAIELIIGTSWILGWSVRWIAYASAALLTIYTLAIAINVARGRVHIGCGCGAPGSDSSDQPVSGGLVIRNCLLISAALIPTMPLRERTLGVVDFVVIAASLSAAILLYAAVAQLLTNRGVINAWRSSRG
jgi:hypothetical protein